MFEAHGLRAGSLRRLLLVSSQTGLGTLCGVREGEEGGLPLSTRSTLHSTFGASFGVDAFAEDATLS
jgi:hypothetical protein